jgi:hypothetical protein
MTVNTPLPNLPRAALRGSARAAPLYKDLRPSSSVSQRRFSAVIVSRIAIGQLDWLAPLLDD